MLISQLKLWLIPHIGAVSIFAVSCIYTVDNHAICSVFCFCSCNLVSDKFKC